MDYSITQVPVWLSILFIVSFSTIPIFLIANAVQKSYSSENIKTGSSLKRKIIIFYLTYFLLVSIISLTGFFNVNSLPPRIILFTVIPLLLFYMLYVQKTAWFKIVFKNITLQQLIYIHIFRFVGVFFFVGYFFNTLPKNFAFIGGLGDIITAALALLLIRVLKKGTPYSKTLIYTWNIIGLLDIISVLITAIILTKTAIENNSHGVEEFSIFPFSLIPAFAPATIIFLHLLVFKKLNKQIKVS